MRKILTLLTLLISLTSVLNAQVQSILVLVSNVNIPMSSIDHYQNGNSNLVTAALSISSDVNWDLSVKSDGDFISGANTISANSFGIEVLTPVGIDQPERFLTISDQLIVDAAADTYLSLIDNPVLLDIRYRAKGGASFLNKPASSYGATLTFTLTPD
ncbi:MAG: hypothetical protein ACJATA_000415 [Sphingobacteriales bacterium]|jgi:hypothetical protein